MPNLNGIEATKQILKIEKEQNLVHTPIVALTAGMDEYMTKPVDKEKLGKILEELLYE